MMIDGCGAHVPLCGKRSIGKIFVIGSEGAALQVQGRGLVDYSFGIDWSS